MYRLLKLRLDGQDDLLDDARQGKRVSRYQHRRAVEQHHVVGRREEAQQLDHPLGSQQMRGPRIPVAGRHDVDAGLRVVLDAVVEDRLVVRQEICQAVAVAAAEDLVQTRAAPVAAPAAVPFSSAGRGARWP